MDVLKSKDNLTLFSLPKVHVIFSGECAIYTMVRNLHHGAHKRLSVSSEVTLS